MRAIAARKASAAAVLRAGFDGTKVLPFSELPGPKWPVLGAVPTMMSYGFSRFSEYYRYMYNTYGVIVDATVLGEPTVIVFDPREFRKVFQLEGRYPKGILKDHWAQEYACKKKGLPMPGIGADGEEWRKTRFALQKDIFNVAAATSYCVPVTNAADVVMTSLKAKTEAGKDVDFHKTMVDAVADVFTAAVFGKSIGMSEGSVSEEHQAWVDGAMRTEKNKDMPKSQTQSGSIILIHLGYLGIQPPVPPHCTIQCTLEFMIDTGFIFMEHVYPCSPYDLGKGGNRKHTFPERRNCLKDGESDSPPHSAALHQILA